MKAKIIVLAFIISCIIAPIVSAGNIVSDEELDDRYEADFPTVWTQVTLNSEITEYLCGYSLDRNTPGDCDGMNSADVPGERWFKFIIPQNSSGNIFDITITNLDDPDYVDLSINLCKSNIYYSSKFICKQYEDMYSNVVQEIRVSPVITSEYWIHIMAWDEEKEGRNEGGDLTQIKVEVAQIASSNSDFIEPREISFNEDIQYSNYREFGWETICAIECDEGPDDPYDIFAVRGFKGDIVELRFGSQEGHSNSDYGVQVFILPESEFFDTNYSFTLHELDDSCSASSSSESCTSIVNHHFEQSGILFIRFYSTQGDDSFGGEEVEEYWISMNYSTASQRDYFADLDGDGMADYHEYECGSEFRDSNSIAPDMDGDFTCDSLDFDIDGDGMSNDEEERCGSNPLSASDTAPDNDLDSFCDQFDDDDDNDGMLDLEEERCGSNPLNASDTAPNFDGDSECDQFDDDDDNDEMSDIEEERCGSNPRNSLDTAPNFDGDSECDQFDTDDDNDDIIDLIDNCPFSDIYYILVDFDLDSDGCFNEEDMNIDGDLYPNSEDDCEYEFGNSTGTWRGCPDSDGDGVPDYLDLYPEDATKSDDEESTVAFTNDICFILPFIIILTLIILKILEFILKRSKENDIYGNSSTAIMGLGTFFGNILGFIYGVVARILKFLLEIILGISNILIQIGSFMLVLIFSPLTYLYEKFKVKGKCILCDEITLTRKELYLYYPTLLGAEAPPKDYFDLYLEKNSTPWHPYFPPYGGLVEFAQYGVIRNYQNELVHWVEAPKGQYTPGLALHVPACKICQRKIIEVHKLKKEAISCHKKHTLPAIKKFEDLKIGNYNRDVQEDQSGLAAKLLVTFTQALESKLEEHVNIDILECDLITPELKHFGELPNVELDFSLAGFSENGKVVPIGELKEKYKEKAKEIEEQTKIIESQSINFVKKECEKINLEISLSADNPSYSETMADIIRAYVRMVNIILSEFKFFQKAAGSKKLIQDDELISRIIHEVYSTDGYVIHLDILSILQLNLSQYICSYCKLNKIPGSYPTNQAIDIEQATENLHQVILEISSNTDWSELGFDWNHIKNKYKDVRDLRNSISSMQKESLEIKKILQEAKHLNLKMATTNEKNLKKIRSEFDKEEREFKLSLLKQIDPELAVSESMTVSQLEEELKMQKEVLDKIKSNTQWSELEFGWNEIQPEFKFPNAINRKIIQMQKDSAEVNKIIQEAERLNLNIAKSKSKNLRYVKDKFQKETENFRKVLLDEVGSKIGGLKPQHDRMDALELQECLSRLERKPNLIKSMPEEIVNEFVDLGMSENTFYQIAESFGREIEIEEWVTYILAILMIDDQHWHEPHFFAKNWDLVNDDKDDRDRIKRLVEYISISPGSLKYAIDEGGSYFSLEDFEFLVRCEKDLDLQPLFIAIKENNFEFSKAKSAIIEWSFDKNGDALNELILTDGDIRTIAAKNKIHQF